MKTTIIKSALVLALAWMISTAGAIAQEVVVFGGPGDVKEWLVEQDCH